MADKGRNFRSAYYDKVGFRSVEEKKSLEILINENPMDREKLKKFCLRFVLPSIHREYVWNVILGVLPVNVESHNTWLTMDREHYGRLAKSMRLQFQLEETSPVAELHVILFHCTEEVAAFSIEEMETCPKLRNLTALASFFSKLSSEDMIAFYLFKNFVLHQRNYTSALTTKPMRENFEALLKKEDETLYEHLKLMKILENIPVHTWFEKCFVEVLHESSLARVFDKIIGGSFIILPCVATALLVGNRHLLLGLTDASKLSEIFENISEDASDAAVNKALDMIHFAAVLERETEQFRSKTTL